MKKAGFISSVLMMVICSLNAQDSTAFKEYFGKYTFSEGSPVTEITIVWLDNQLNVTSAMGNAAMNKTGIDSFSMDYADGIVIFCRDSVTKKVSGLTIYVSGMTLEGKKADEQEAVGLKITPAKKEEIVSHL